MERKKCRVPLERRFEELLDRRRNSSTLRTLTLPRPSHVDFSSNDFLSLSKSPALKNAYLSRLEKADFPLGSGGSRLLDGNSSYAEDLEREIAAFHGAASGLLFNSGFDANAGFFACVPQPGDVIVYDELVHASVHDGMRLSRASSRVPFPHNSISGLTEVIKELLDGSQKLRQGESNIIIAVEAIYSMDGDLAPLKQIVEIVEDLLGKDRGHIVVDEAHSTGVLGSHGRGLVCELGLEDRIFARLHTFGKSLAGNGGEFQIPVLGVLLIVNETYMCLAIILGSLTLRHYLVNYARSLIYTTFLSYPSLALISASYSLLQSGATLVLQEHLQDLTQTLYQALQDLHTKSLASRKLLQIPTACPKSPIFSIQLENPRNLAQFLQDRNMMVRAVVPPTVPLGTQRIRVCLHAGNSEADIEKLVHTLSGWCEAILRQRDNHDGCKLSVQSRL